MSERILQFAAASAPLRSRFVPALLLLAAGFYLATLRPGHRWGDDFALYLSHARNIALGFDYRATGYTFNPAALELSPRNYPPLVPLLLLYLFTAVEALLTRVAPAAFRQTVIAGYLAAVLVYGAAYARADYGPIGEGIGNPAFQQLCAAVRNLTNPSDVVIFLKPRLLALLTGRATATYSKTADQEALWENITSLGGRYVVLAMTQHRCPRRTAPFSNRLCHPAPAISSRSMPMKSFACTAFPYSHQA